MATDFQGKTINVADRYLVAGQVRAVAGDLVVIVLDDGRAIHCDAADLIRVAGYLPLDGADAMSGALKLIDGSSSSPGAQFANESTLGMYRAGTSLLAFTGTAVGFGGAPSYPVHSKGSGNRVLMVESLSAAAAELRLKNTVQHSSFGLSAAGAFALTDVTAGTAPFWIQPAAPSFSFYMNGSGQVGFSTLTLQSTVHVGGSFARKSVTVTGTTHNAGAEATILGDCTSNNINVNLPAAATCTDREYHVLKIDGTANTFTITPAGAETINGAGSKVYGTQFAGGTIKCDGTQWFILP